MPDILDTISARFAGLADFHRRAAEAAGLGPRTLVRCRFCGATETVDGAVAMRFGWPLHCGETMRLDRGAAGEAAAP